MKRDPALHRHRWRLTIVNGQTYRWGWRDCYCGARVNLGPEDVARILERRRRRGDLKASREGA